jgi:hypothetical protein
MVNDVMVGEKECDRTAVTGKRHYEETKRAEYSEVIAINQP